MKVYAVYRKLDFSFPIKQEPQWASHIDRWYQLDAFAYGLAEAYYTLRDDQEKHPDFVFLASKGASNQTDFQFARTGASSPSKFVHTLPNIRGSSLFQLMSYKGPLLCIQNDPSTQLTAFREALDMLRGQDSKIWIWSVSGNYTVHWFELRRDFKDDGKHEVFEIEDNPRENQKNEFVSDASFLAWLGEKNPSSFRLPGNYSMRALTKHVAVNHMNS